MIPKRGLKIPLDDAEHPSPAMTPRSKLAAKRGNLDWPSNTELVGLEFSLIAERDYELYPQYTIGLHAWFLKQIAQFDPALSAHLHDDESEKPFAITGLNGQFVSQSRTLQLQKDRIYRWQVNGLSQQMVTGLAVWLQQLPETLVLKNLPLIIQQVQVVLPATTYTELIHAPDTSNSLSLSFLSPTSFRRKGHHLPLPWPRNVFHSYLRRWNLFSGEEVWVLAAFGDPNVI